MLPSSQCFSLLLLCLTQAAFASSPFHRNWGGGSKPSNIYGMPLNQQNNIANYRTTVNAVNQTNIRAGEILKTIYEWKILDFLYETQAQHAEAIAKG
jgi:hypothetical protein